MKKIAALFLAITLIFSLAACSGAPSGTSAPQNTERATEPNASTAPVTEHSSEPEESTAPTETKKTLVVYFSASGNTQRVAEEIAEAANADLFEIVPEQPYTSDDLNWSDNNSRVSREHEDEALRIVPLETTEVPNWDSYDTVLIGYPIWWGIAAWPVNQFVEGNDFTGKAVIPFATSASSGMGESGALLRDLAGSGDWQEGQRFSSSASTEDIQAWISGLNLA